MTSEYDPSAPSVPPRDSGQPAAAPSDGPAPAPPPAFGGSPGAPGTGAPAPGEPRPLPTDLPGIDQLPGVSPPSPPSPAADEPSAAAPEAAAEQVAESTAPSSLEGLLQRKHPASANPLPRVLAVANQKGGVGKTTTTINLAACLAEIGYRVLVVDLDPQANATTGLGIDPRGISSSMYDVILRDVPLAECALPTAMEGLRVAPSSLDLAGAEIELVPAFNRERKLALAIETMLPELDFVLIDCPPSLGLLTVNALTAADEVLVPIQCEYYALEGLGQLLRNVELVQRNLNAELEVSTIALVMYDARTKLATQVVDEVRAHFGDRVCRQVVPRSVRLSEAPSFGQPIIAFDSRSRGALAYRELAKEVSGGPPNRVG